LKKTFCPWCLLDEFYNWFLDCEWRGTDNEHIGMIEEGLAILLMAIEEGIPSTYLCETHWKYQAEQMEPYGREVRAL